MLRRSFIKTTLGGAAGLAGGLLLPGSASAKIARQEAGTLTIGSNSAVATLNPAKGGNGDPIALFYEMAYESLVTKMPDGSYGPGLATEFGYTDDKNKVFELKLREGVKFSDGGELTAEGVKAFWEYYGVAKGPMAKRVKYFDTVEVTGPLSFRINLAKSNPILPYYFMQRTMMGAINDWWLGGGLSNALAHETDPAVFPGLNTFQIFVFFLALLFFLLVLGSIWGI